VFLDAKDRLRAILYDDLTEVRMMLSHPMLPSKQDEGAEQEAHFIQSIHCWRNDEQMLVIHCSEVIATDPYFSFQLEGGEVGDVIRVRWVDNLGGKGIIETPVR